MLVAVPESVTESLVVLDGHRINGRVNFEAALLEHHHRGVVDASALGEYEQWLVGLLGGMLLHASGD